MARDSMTLDEVIQFTKQALEKVNPDNRVHTEFRFAVWQVKRLLAWLEDYKQLKSDYADLDNRLRTANTDIDRLQSVSSWIPCSERMPEDDEEVLFAVAYPWDKGKKPTVSLGRHYTRNGEGWWTNYYGGFLDYEVTHWMPLPEVPQRKDDTNDYD